MKLVKQANRNINTLMKFKDRIKLNNLIGPVPAENLKLHYWHLFNFGAWVLASRIVGHFCEDLTEKFESQSVTVNSEDVLSLRWNFLFLFTVSQAQQASDKSLSQELMEENSYLVNSMLLPKTDIPAQPYAIPFSLPYFRCVFI